MAALGAVMVVSASGCGDGGGKDERILEAVCSEPPRATVENFMAVRLPPSAQVAQIDCKGFTDTFVRARVDVPRTELDTLISGANFSGPLRPGYRPFADTATDTLGWKVDAIVSVAGHEERCLSAKDVAACATGLAGRRVMVDLDDPVRAVVYLEAFTS